MCGRHRVEDARIKPHPGADLMLDTSKPQPSPPAGEVITSFPREYYISPDWFEREMDQVLSRQ